MVHRDTAEGLPTVAPEREVYKDPGAAQHCEECQQELGGLQQSRHVQRGCLCCGRYQVGVFVILLLQEYRVQIFMRDINE